MISKLEYELEYIDISSDEYLSGLRHYNDTQSLNGRINFENDMKYYWPTKYWNLLILQHDFRDKLIFNISHSYLPSKSSYTKIQITVNIDDKLFDPSLILSALDEVIINLKDYKIISSEEDKSISSSLIDTPYGELYYLHDIKSQLEIKESIEEVCKDCPYKASINTIGLCKDWEKCWRAYHIGMIHWIEEQNKKPE